MDTPIGYITRKLPRFHRRHRTFTSPPAPVAPTLVSAVFLDEPYRVVLTFDVAVNVDDFQPATISVRDANTTMTMYEGGSATLSDPFTVVVALEAGGEIEGSGVTMTASDSTGIVAETGGLAWAGVTELSLPFEE